jgi:hypothetical protein
MLRTSTSFALIALSLLCSSAATAQAAPVSSDEPAVLPSEEPNELPIARLDHRRGFLFAPSAPSAGAFRLGVGILFDAVDPQVMYGFNVRVPQLTVDARFGLGKGWSLRGRLNSMLITTEFLLGGAYAWRMRHVSLEVAANVGVYLGQLGQFNFDASLFAPEYRPELALAYDFGDVVVSLRASLLLMGPERVRIGGIWGDLDNANLFVGHSEMLIVENALSSGGVWYFGVGAMTTRAYYQMWLLFPDSPALFTYFRTVAGYEF